MSSFARSNAPIGGKPRVRVDRLTARVRMPAHFSNPTLVEYAGEYN